MSHSFSLAHVKQMEPHLDLNIRLLKARIREHCARPGGAVFDLKRLLHFYVVDVLGELAFSQSFGVQESDDESRVPPVIEHSLLAAVTGAWPAMTRFLKKWLPVVPHRALQTLLAGRRACVELAASCVQQRLLHVRADETKQSVERTDLLTNLIQVKDPDTGEGLTQTDLETEAFGFMYG